MRKILLISVLCLFLFSFVNATTTCSPTSLTLNFTEGGTIPTGSILCNNDDTNNTVAISKIGAYFSVDQTVIGKAPSQKTITITPDSSIPAGIHFGLVEFSDGSSSIPIFLEVNKATQTTQPPCSLDIFPTVLTNIKIQQGETKTRNIQLSVPSCFNGAVTIQGVALQTDEKPIQLGELSIGNLQPGSSIQIPIDIDARDVSTGTYSDTLQLLLYNSTGGKINVPTVSLGVTVTSGIQPITNFSLGDLPTCSIDATEMNLNSTYTLTCSRTNPNIDIEPILDYKHIKGTSVSETSSQYIYTFKAILIGNTQVGAKFKYKNAELGTPFLRDIRISPSGSSAVGGIELKLSFYQKGIKKSLSSIASGETTILVLDNSTNNVIPIYTLYINGEKSNNSIELETGKDYEIRASASGYLDRIINLTVNAQPIQITINPSQETYSVGETIDINTDINGTTLKIGSTTITSPWLIDRSGNITILATAEGSEDSNITLEIKPRIELKACNPSNRDEWKVGKKILCDLNENVSWEVYKDGELYESGSGVRVEFKIDDKGYWEIKGDSRFIEGIQIDNASYWWKPWSWDVNWWYVGVGILIVGVIIYFLFSPKKKDESSGFVVGGG